MGRTWVACPHLSLRIWFSAHMTSMQSSLWKQWKRNRTNGKCDAHIEGDKDLARHALKKQSLWQRASHRWAGKVKRDSLKKANAHIQQCSSRPGKPWDDFFSQTTIYKALVALLRFTWWLWTDPSSTMKGQRWQGPYLAVCGADRKSDVGGDHHCESWGQFNGEAAVGGSTRDTS